MDVFDFKSKTCQNLCIIRQIALPHSGLLLQVLMVIENCIIFYESIVLLKDLLSFFEVTF